MAQHSTAEGAFVLKSASRARSTIYKPRYKSDACDMNPGEAYYGTERYKQSRARDCPYIDHLELHGKKGFF